MVGPSITAEERDIANRRLKYGFVLLVAVSAVLMSLQIDPTIEQVAAVFVGGLIFGAVLLWFVLRNLQKFYYRL
ncbi:hypothetical protein [Halalkalirubrum salinum]|uniref:hypothetical protein n=1 Tax=Halalkalirubrum salinum TaxID=2563889 RepID=UPI0010FADBD0|nr:hypothetical protein [Halalkalirubrum salinum]